jgi:hypothetical protein
MGIIILFFMGYMIFKFEEVGEHQKTVSWLPTNATDISYFKNINYTVYECDLDEESFLLFSKKNHWSIKQIDSSPVDILRYKFPTIYTPSENETQLFYSDLIYDGYIYDTLSERGGIRVVYDSSIQRLYVFNARK